MIYSMVINPSISALLFPVWIMVGIAIYAGYGYKKNRMVEQSSLMAIDAEKNENSVVIN